MKKEYLSKLFVASVIIVLSAVNAFGQLTVNTGMTPVQMVQNLAGPGVQIFNVQVTGAPGSFGYYTASNTEIGTNQGLLLTTGQATNALGPNNATGFCNNSINPLACEPYDNHFPGSALLNTSQNIAVTYDAVTFEFDIIPAGDSLRFDYTFASEEYPEWVDINDPYPFNDVFGFYVTGPNVGTDVNIAVIPNTNNIVAINSVNHLLNTQYYQGNNGGQYVQYDGFTKNLVAEIGNLLPCNTYHIKLIIADGRDRVYDSGVFINQIESNPVVVLTSTANGLDYMIEGCNDGTVTFARTFATPFSQTVTYWVDGTATNGVDYTQLGNGLLNDPIEIVIPANQFSVTIPVQAFEDNLPEGIEFLTIYIGNPLCTGTEPLDSVTFEIHDFQPATVVASDENICVGQCTTLTGDAATFGDATFAWSPLNGIVDPNSLVTDACPTQTTTYTLTSTAGNCSSSAQVTINVTSISLTLTPSQVNCQNGSTGSITLSTSDGVEPLTYEWTGPNGFTSSAPSLTGIPAGQYCVTITDANGCTATACATVIETNQLAIATEVLSNYTCYPISCFGASDGSVNIELTGGVPQFDYEWSGPNGFTSTSQDISGVPAGVYTVTITDDAGCVLTDSYTLQEPAQLQIQVSGIVNLLCTGAETGQAQVSATGGCTPYFFSWSHDPNLTAPIATNLGSGTYTANVSDINGCQSTGSVNIEINDPIDPINLTVDQISLYPGNTNTSCAGVNDAFINITPDGGTTPYTVNWYYNSNFNSPFSTAEDLVNAPCGHFDLVVTDANGCVVQQSFDLSCVSPIQITQTSVPNPCGNESAGQGQISILTTTGGHGGAYTYSWTGPDGYTSLNEDITGLNSGDYVVTVTDNSGCTQTFNANVGTNDVFDVTATQSNVNCSGQCTGSINITPTPSGIYSFVWTGPNGNLPSTEDQFNLCAGSYTVLVSDNLCNGTYTYQISEPNPIVITVVSANNPICFGQNNGSIDISVSGGTGQLNVSWQANPQIFFNGSSSQDIFNLFSGCYTVIVTDQAGCSATQTICLSAPQLMNISVEVSEFNGGFNISCADAQDGQISVSVSGGTPDCSGFAPYCYQYDWSNCSDVTPNDPNAPSLTSLQGGTYCVNVTDANGCLATTTINLTEPQPIDDNSVVTNVTCNGANNGTITPGLTGGSGTYIDFDWTAGNIGNNAPNATTLTNLAPGCYTLVVTDNNQCSSTFTWCITQPSPLQLSVDLVQQFNCVNANDASIVVSASGGSPDYSFTTTGPGGPYSGNVIGPLGPGTYTVTVTDQFGCSDAEQVVITTPPPFTVSLTPVNVQCFGNTNGVINSSVSGGTANYSYSWTNSNNVEIGTGPSLSNLPVGSYCLEVTDQNECVATACTQITGPPTPLNITSNVFVYSGGHNVSCFNACDGSIDITVSGGVGPYEYLWELGGGVIDHDQDQTDLCAGSYAVLVIDANDCSQVVEFTLTQPTAVQLDITESQYNGGYNISCNESCDGSITTVPSGGQGPYTVNWLNPSLPQGTSQTDLCAGGYQIQVVDANGCAAQYNVTLTQPQPLVANITSQYFCESGVLQLCSIITGGTGPYSQSWSNESNASCINVLQDGSTCVNVMDANECMTETCIDYIVPDALQADIVSTNPTCGINTGTIDVTVFGGTDPITYTWTGPGVVQNSPDQINLGPGFYTVTITDNNDCFVVLSATLEDLTNISVTANITNLLCHGDKDGSIAVLIEGAEGPVTINWTGPNGTLGSDNPLTALSAGAYTLSWEDANGCSGTETYFVLEPPAITINGTISFYENGYNVSGRNASDGTIDTEVQGGTPQYTYNWSPNDEQDGDSDISNLAGGVYTLTVTDANGCSVDTSFIVTEPVDLEFPTGLSPNGDDYNEGYVILGIEGFPKNEFKVFNRWGNLVYEKSNYNNDWVGQNNSGEMLPDGTYYIVFVTANHEFNTYVDLRR